MATADELNELITSGRILFDPPAEQLRRELLGIEPARAVHSRVQTLVVALCAKVPGRALRISSLYRNEGHHGVGRAVDIANEEIAGELLPLVAIPSEVQRLGIDEIIFDASLVTGEPNRNRYNFDQGRSHQYDAATLGRHRTHIHFSVRA